MKKTTKCLIGGAIMSALFMGSGTTSGAMEPPEEVELGAISQLYGPVTFNHQMHVDVATSCATCHHHTTGTPPEDKNCLRCHKSSGPAATVACQKCHPTNRFEAEYLKKLDSDNTIYHTGKVSLKAAYHLKCMGCHEQMGGPKGCQDCHTRNDAGDKFFRAGKYAPPPDKKVPWSDKAEEHVGGHE